MSFCSNCLKFNGYDCFSFTISEPTELATASHGVLALVMIEGVPRPGPSRFRLEVRRTCAMRAFTVRGERPGRTLEEVLARMEVLGAVADECEAVRWSVGFFPRWAERRERTGGGGGGAPRAMLWAGIRRSYRTRVVWVMVDPERCSGLVYSVPTERGWCG